MFTKLKATGAIIAAAIVTSPVYAAAVDVSDAVSNISSNEGSVSAIGVAGLGLVVAAAVFKYIRRAV